MTKMDLLESEKYPSFMIRAEIMGKHGLPSTFMSVDSLWSFLEHLVQQKNSPVTCVAHILEKNISSSTYRALAKSLVNYTKQSKNSKTVSFTITGTEGDVGIFAEPILSSSPIHFWTLVSCLTTDGVFTALWVPDEQTILGGIVIIEDENEDEDEE